MEAENFEVCLGLRVGDVNLEIFIASPYDVLNIIVSPIPNCNSGIFIKSFSESDFEIFYFQARFRKYLLICTGKDFL